MPQHDKSAPAPSGFLKIREQKLTLNGNCGILRSATEAFDRTQS
jgi:hypothetical protein